MTLRDRLKNLGIEEGRLNALGLGAPAAPPAVDETLVSDLAAKNGQAPEVVRAVLQRQATSATEAKRPALVRAFNARPPQQPTRPRNPFKPDPDDGPKAA